MWAQRALAKTRLNISSNMVVIWQETGGCQFGVGKILQTLSSQDKLCSEVFLELSHLLSSGSLVCLSNLKFVEGGHIIKILSLKF